MKNLSIKLKMVISFTTVIILSMIIGFVGIICMSRMNAADDELYNGNYLPTVMACHIAQNVMEQRVLIRNFIFYDILEDESSFKGSEDSLAAAKSEMTDLLARYKDTITDSEDQSAFDEFVNTYNNQWLQLVDEVHSLGAADMPDEAEAVLTAGTPTATKMDELAEKLQNINIGYGQKAVESNTSLYVRAAVILGVIMFVSLVLSLYFEIHVSHLIRFPLEVLSKFMNRAGSTGNISMEGGERESLDKYAQYRDEVGQCIKSTVKFLRHVITVSDNLEAVADGDLTVDVRLLSENDIMGKSMKKMVDGLNNMFGEINSSTAQVTTGAKQVADGSQILAHGATEQAAAVEQLSSSIAEITEKTRENAEMASQAADLANTIIQNAEKGSAQMENMMDAVRDINQASQSINKVIKVIDDIAFQTNILALNAAVEAARAGQHGKGFAVVAEEVRNLAAKSAEAAKDTGALITNSMEKAELGARIAGETSDSLAEIVSGINESSRIVEEIAKSSGEQASGISTLNKGIEQVSMVIQNNSATAQESSAASEEMSSQASILEDLVAQFRLRDAASMSHGLAQGSRPPLERDAMSTKTSYPSLGDQSEYGKY